MSTTSAAARTRIQQLAKAYSEGEGDYRHQPIRWNSRTWSNEVRPGWNLSSPLTRQAVLDIVRSAVDVDSAERAFVAIMIWGYGSTGYGPHRVGEMRVSRSEGLGKYLLNIIEQAQDGPAEAYRLLANDKASKLGPSYASKVAYFVTPGEASPILDSVVAGWVQAHHESKRLFNSQKWSTPQYIDFQSYCHELLEFVGPLVPEGHRTLGLVEYLMFIDQAATALPKWARTI